MADGTSRWITGARARAHGHLERAQHQAILVGCGTLEADAPKLDVRLTGLEGRSPRKLLLTSGKAPAGWTAVARSEGRRGGKGCVRKCRARWWPYHEQKTKIKEK